jgi:hypothetical protein
MINHIILEKMLLHIILFFNDVKIYFTFISFIIFSKKKFDKVLGIE